MKNKSVLVLLLLCLTISGIAQLTVSANKQELAPHSEGFGSEWLLIIDNAAKAYANPNML